jgi:hypothetical protein
VKETKQEEEEEQQQQQTAVHVGSLFYLTNMNSHFLLARLS